MHNYQYQLYLAVYIAVYICCNPLKKLISLFIFVTLHIFELYDVLSRLFTVLSIAVFSRTFVVRLPNPYKRCHGNDN